MLRREEFIRIGIVRGKSNFKRYGGELNGVGDACGEIEGMVS